MPKKPAIRRIRTAQGYRYIDSKGRFASADAWNLSDAKAKLDKQRELRQAKKKNLAPGLAPQARMSVRGPDGRFIPSKKASGEPRKVIRSSLGQKVPTSRSKVTKSRRKVWTDFADNLDPRLGDIPKADATQEFRSDSGRILVYYWRFEGLDSQSTVKRLLLALQRNLQEKGKQVSTRFAVGTGFGKQSDWMGSKFNVPSDTVTFFGTWNTSTASGQRIYALAQAGQPIWFEVEAQVREPLHFAKAKQGSRKHGSGRKASKTSNGKGVSASRNGNGKQRSKNPSKPRKSASRTLGNGRRKLGRMGPDSARRRKVKRKSKR